MEKRLFFGLLLLFVSGGSRIIEAGKRYTTSEMQQAIEADLVKAEKNIHRIDSLRANCVGRHKVVKELLKISGSSQEVTKGIDFCKRALDENEKKLEPIQKGPVACNYRQGIVRMSSFYLKCLGDYKSENNVSNLFKQNLIEADRILKNGVVKLTERWEKKDKELTLLAHYKKLVERDSAAAIQADLNKRIADLTNQQDFTLSLIRNESGLYGLLREKIRILRKE